MSFKTVVTLIVIACLSFNSLNAQQNVSYKFGDNPKVGSYYNHDGVKIYYEIYGQGKPLVLLHGNGGSIGSRAKLIPEFAAHYQVIAFDSRCHGKTDCPSGYLTYEQMASDVNAVLNHLKIDSAYIWGHCWVAYGHQLSEESKKTFSVRCQLTTRHHGHRPRLNTHFG